MNVHKYLKGGCKVGGARLISGVPSERTSIKECILEHTKWHFNIRRKLLYIEGGQILE